MSERQPQSTFWKGVAWILGLLSMAFAASFLSTSIVMMAKTGAATLDSLAVLGISIWCLAFRAALGVAQLLDDRGL